MSFLDTLSVGGGATGMALYRKMMEDAAAVNENLANANYIDQQQNAPLAMPAGLPAAPVAGVTPPKSTNPTVSNVPITVVPQAGVNGAWWQAGIKPPALPTSKATYQPGMTGRAVAPSVDPNKPWVTYPSEYGWNRDPNNPFGVNTGPQYSPLQNFLGGISNIITNAPSDLSNAVGNLTVAPLAGLAQWATTAPGGAQPTAKLSTPGTTPAKSVNTTTSGATASTPAGQSGATPYPSTDAASAGVAGPSPATPATPSTDMVKVRKEALRAPPEWFNYQTDQLTQQRQQIADDANARINFINQQRQQVASQTQAQIAMLTQRASAAQKTGNIGLMQKFQDEANLLISNTTTQIQTFDQQAFEVQQAANGLFRQNDQNLWNVQAMQAENEFVNNGDPTRMLHILDAYGQSLQLQDAGNGKYYAIDLRTQQPLTDSDGKAKAFTRDEFATMFHSAISDEFRQQQAATQASNAAELFKTQLEMMKNSADNAEKAKIEIIKNSFDKYFPPQQSGNGDGTIVMVPKDPASGLPVAIYNPNPDPIPGSNVTPPKITFQQYGG